MADWNTDEFMSQWDKKYVSTNVKTGAQQYNKEFFLGLNSRLCSLRPELQCYSYALIVGPAKFVIHTFNPYTSKSPCY